MASVEERLKYKRGHVDPWSTRERLCLASCVVRSGNQNWMSVGRSLRGFGAEPGRPADWFSQKSCAVQYDNLLTQIETPKRKKRGADGSKTDGVDLTPAEIIVKHLTGERIEELSKLMAEARAVYVREKEDLYHIQNGLVDDKLDELLAQMQEDKKQKEVEQEEHQRWLRQREERKQEMEMAWRPHGGQQNFRGSIRRPSTQSDLASETDIVESSSSSEQQPTASEETPETKPVSTPTSPLLTSLLKSPSPVTGSQSSSILHSAITSQRGASPTITSLLNSSPGVPSSSTAVPVSPNVKSLVSNTLAGHDGAQKQPSHSTSSSPTLSMLLELPPSTPGKLPELPYSATKPTTTPTAKPGEGKEGPTVEPEVPIPSDQDPDQCHSAIEIVLGVEVPNPPDQCLEVQAAKSHKERQPPVSEILPPKSPDWSHSEDVTLSQAEVSDSPKLNQPAAKPMECTEAFKSLQTSAPNSAVVDPTSVDQSQSSEDAVNLEDSELSKNLQSSVELKLQTVAPTAQELTEPSVESVVEDISVPPDQGQQGESNVDLPSEENIKISYQGQSEGVLSTDAHQNTSESHQITPSEPDQQGHPCLENHPDNIEITAKPEVNAGEVVDSTKKEPLLDINNMEIIMPETETKAPEAQSKVNLDSADLQQISTDDLQYVVDPSILQQVQEFVPEGLVDEMVFIVSSDDVEADVGNMIENSENSEPNVSEQVESKVENVLPKDNEEVLAQEQKEEKTQEELAPVVHSSPALQSPQRAITTPSSVAVSPRSGGRPVKGSMVARKIVMEEEEVSKPEVLADEGIRPLEGDADTLDLESAGVLLLQDNGQVVKLSESGQTTSLVDDIHVIQDSTNGAVVVVKDSESSKTTTDDNENKSTEVVKDTSPEKKSPIRTIHKVQESPVKKIDESKTNLEAQVKLSTPTAKPSRDVKSPSPQKDSRVVEQEPPEKTPDDEEDVVKEDVSEKRKDPLSPKEGHKKPKPVLLAVKRDKSPVISESSNDLASEEDTTKEEPAEDIGKEISVQSTPKENEKEKQARSSNLQLEDEDARHADSDVHVTQIKEEKVRSDTPSTEDDSTRDTEPVLPVRRGRGRYARDSTTNSDSIPNSPTPTNASHDDEKEHKAWKKSIILVYNRIATHKNASVFLKPITDDIAPGYTSTIHKRLDLQTIKKTIETGGIRTTDEFQRDILIMLYNAIMYNKINSPIYDMALEMQRECVAHLEEYKSTQLYLQNSSTEGGLLPSRRGTRTAEKRDLDSSEGFVTRRGLAEKSGSARGVFNTTVLGKRKRSLPDDKINPKRRRDDD